VFSRADIIGPTIRVSGFVADFGVYTLQIIAIATPYSAVYAALSLGAKTG